MIRYKKIWNILRQASISKRSECVTRYSHHSTSDPDFRNVYLTSRLIVMQGIKMGLCAIYCKLVVEGNTSYSV